MQYLLSQKNFYIVYVIGEANALLAEMMSPWLDTRLSSILSDYSLADIYNAHKFGLFYQALSSKTMHKKLKCVGGKFSKLRLTGLGAGNALDQKLPMFVIGRANKPRFFKNLKRLPCCYRGLKKVGWMAIYSRSGFVSRIEHLSIRIRKS